MSKMFDLLRAVYGHSEYVNNNRKRTIHRRRDEDRHHYEGSPKNEFDAFIEKRCIEADISVKAMIIHQDNNADKADYYKNKENNWRSELSYWLEIASESLSKHRLKDLNKKLAYA